MSKKLYDCCHSIIEADGPWLGTWTPEKLAEECEQRELLVSEDSHQIKALLLFMTVPGGVEILFMGTAPQFRRKGIMLGLLRELKSKLKQGESIWLEVDETNSGASLFYKSQGFQRTGYRPDYYGKNRGAILMGSLI